MNKAAAIKLCDEKIAELKSTIAALKTNDAISKATRGTQLYARGRERRVLHLISELFAQCGTEPKLSEDAMNTFVLITTLAAEREQRESIVINEGDSVLALLQKYDGKKDIYNKLMKAAEKAGLKQDAKGVFVKA